METAIKEARKCKPEDNRTHPKVGVVIIKGNFEGRAFRGERGAGDHAEYTALERKYHRKSIAGATVYVTLEPCTTRNHPKTPCAHWLIERKVSRVVVGMLDPNPQICGKGIRLLRDANIAVDLFPPDLMAEVEELNREFIREYQTVSFRVPSELNRGAGANLINPHYSNDCQRLDDSEFDLRTVIGKETIFIVVGDGLVSALVEYPVAGMLRDEIDRCGGGRQFRRAVIIGCNRWQNDAALKAKKYPTLSIGGDESNELTGHRHHQAAAESSIDWLGHPAGICHSLPHHLLDYFSPIHEQGDGSAQSRSATAANALTITTFFLIRATSPGLSPNFCWRRGGETVVVPVNIRAPRFAGRSADKAETRKSCSFSPGEKGQDEGEPKN